MVAIGAVAAKAAEVAESVATEEAAVAEVAESEVVESVVQEMAKEVGSDAVRDLPSEIVGEDALSSMPSEAQTSELKEATEEPIDNPREFFSDEGPYLRDMDERIRMATRGDGEWVVEGNSILFKPNDKNAKELLKSNGLDGIKYDKFAEPDFSPIAKETVEIEKMTSNRFLKGGNYEQAFQKLSERWNSTDYGGRSDWKVRDVEKWVKDNHLSPHERSDMRTVDFVPTDVHNAVKHYGGVSECNAKEGKIGGVLFDER